MKKILAIFSAMVLIVSVLSVIALSDFNDNTTIVYGSNANSRDVIAAEEISESIIGPTTTTTTVVLGNESVLIQSHGNDLNFGEPLVNITSKFNYKDLPSILAEGEVEYSDGSIEGYTQILKFGNNSVKFDSLDEDDYVIDTNSSNKKTPIFYMDLENGYLWNLIIEFDDPLDATELDEDSVISIAGKEYNFKPNMKDTDDELVLYASGEKLNLNLEETVNVIIGGETVSLKLIGANDDEDGDKIFIEVDGEIKKIKENNAIGINGEKVYANEIMIREGPEYKVTVELFIGAEELKLDIPNDFNTIEVNGKALDGVEANVIGNISNGIELIEFKFIPTDMDDVEDEIQFLEIGESIVDPIFGTISLVFDSVSSVLDSEDRDFIELETSGDELEITFTNVDGNEISFIPYEINKSDDLDSIFITNNIGEEDNIIIVQIKDKITEIFRIEDVNTNNVELYSYTEDETEEYKINDILEGDVKILKIIGTEVEFSKSSNILYSENEMIVTLNPLNITFNESRIDSDESTTNPIVITANLVNTTEGDIEIKSISGADTVEDDDDNEYIVTEGYTTYFKRDDDGKYLKVYVPEEENDFNIYITDAVTTEKTNETSTSLIVSDTNTDAIVEGDIIVIGGSCVNTFAAELLGSYEPLCGEAFTEKTGVGEGEFIIKVYEKPDNKKVILIAGYEVEDTERAVEYFLTQKPSLEIGTDIIL